MTSTYCVGYALSYQSKEEKNMTIETIGNNKGNKNQVDIDNSRLDLLRKVRKALGEE